MPTEEGLQPRTLILGHRKAPGIFVEIDPDTGRVLTPVVVLREMAARIAEAGGNAELGQQLRSMKLPQPMDEKDLRFGELAMAAKEDGFLWVCLGCGRGMMHENEEHECSGEFR